MSAATGSRAVRFVASLALLAGCVVGVPWLLTVAATARFGGRAPWHGVPAPGAWTWSTIRRSLTDRLTEDTIADIVLRTSLAVAWLAVVVLLVTVVVEVLHMVRHGGLSMPDIRGLGAPQSLARIIAVGLLVAVPLVTSPSRAVARDGVAGHRPPNGVAGATLELVVAPSGGSPGTRHQSAAVLDVAIGLGPETAIAGAEGASEYVVRAGDSVFGIAERLAGPDPSAVASFAEQLVEVNIGRQMPDGERFTNAAYLDVGWVLVLPSSPTSGGPIERPARPDGPAHVVARGETLWSIAEDELGDPARWPEIYEVNRGRAFVDGRTFDDPSLIQPGWRLDLPGSDAAPQAEPGSVPADHPVAEPVDPPADLGPGEETSPDPGVAPSTEVPAAQVADVVDDPDDDELGGRTADPSRPTNRWIAAPVSSSDEPAGGPSAPPIVPAGAVDDLAAGETPEAPAPLLTLERAAMLSAGVLTLLTVRRRSQLRRARPRARVAEPDPIATTTERTLRAIAPGDRLLRVDLAVRSAAMPLVAAGRRVVAVTASDDGAIELHASGPARLDAPWVPTDDPRVHELPATVAVELIAESARGVGAPCPTLVQLGRTLDERDLYVDLEALEAIEVGGPGDAADAIVTAVAATLAGSVLAEVTTLVGVGVDDSAFLGHRGHVPVRDSATAFAWATEAIGSTATKDRSTFELRARGTGGETWEPAIVLLGSSVGTVTPPTDRTGLAVVSASPIRGPSYRLAPDDGAWTLRPLGVRCQPIGLEPRDLTALTALLRTVDTEPVDERPVAPTIDALRFAGVHVDDDLTLAPIPDDSSIDGCDESDDSGPPSTPRPPILVRLLGPVSIRSADGREAAFEKSKAKELIAWLATHRERATRSGARTALWELDVRDATFANVVSEARRSLARLVAPPEGEEWIARTLTEALPLHGQVRTDADLVREALDAARLQAPAQAIATLRPTIELVVGMPFEGTGYLWPEAEGIASQLVLLATTATAELAAHCLSVGDIDGVFDATARGLQVLPGHEELIGLRMRAHATAGDPAGVRLEWEQYERIVDADPWSDGEPSPTLVDLRRELLAR